MQTNMIDRSLECCTTIGIFRFGWVLRSLGECSGSRAEGEQVGSACFGGNVGEIQ